MNLRSNGEKHTEYIVASHINKFITYYCNSDKQKVQDLNYLDTVSDSKAKSFVTAFYDYIANNTELFLEKMDKGEIEITHDFYLKKFQLSNPKLNYDYILFDEGQDASAAMLDVFFKQEAIKVIVGDTHQQIYGWRYAVNSLEKADFKTYNLSTSFRFSQDIANLAVGVLKFKKHIDEIKPIPIMGNGRSQENKTKAVLARTNLGLLLKAIEYVTKKKNIQHIYFEGNINSYTYADEGASLYDVLNLYNGNHEFIRDKLIKTMNDIVELEEYIEKTEDIQLGMMVDIVRKYGNEIPNIIKKIKEKHVQNDEKEKAEMIFSTVHRCKGMEYDAVQLVNDFITEEKLEKLKEDKKKVMNSAKLNEEINLLYVAVTRTRNRIHIPEALLPKGFPSSSQISVIRASGQEEKEPRKIIITEPFTPKKFTKTETAKQFDIPRKLVKVEAQNPKAYSVEAIRQIHKEAYQPWTEKEDKELRKKFNTSAKIPEIAVHFNRTTGAIRSRLKKLGLITAEKILKQEGGN